MIIGKLPEAELFALAGGGALIARGDVDRQTRDLDFFGPDPAGVDKLVPAVERALHEAGMNVRRVREGRGFFLLEVREHEEVTEVDLGADARLLPIERGELGPILAGGTSRSVLGLNSETGSAPDIAAATGVRIFSWRPRPCSACAPPAGLEPAPPAPEAGALSAELRGLEKRPKWRPASMAISTSGRQAL